mmetsp:Transcript_28539/g.83490  ORF Transcript_28539/g.83490 Transcript_28539/m.83490 type:complete len:399 (+) Transcript_28539:286-1482(+)
MARELLGKGWSHSRPVSPELWTGATIFPPRRSSKVFLVEGEGDSSIDRVLLAHGLKVGTDDGGTTEEHANVRVDGPAGHVGKDLVPVGTTIPDPDVLEPVGGILGRAHGLNLLAGGDGRVVHLRVELVHGEPWWKGFAWWDELGRRDHRRHGLLLLGCPGDVHIDLAVVAAPVCPGLICRGARALLEVDVLELGNEVEEPLESVHLSVLDNPVEVELLWGLAEAPAVLEHGREHRSARGHANASADDHDGFVVQVVLGRGRVRTVDPEDGLVVHAEAAAEHQVSPAVPGAEVVGEALPRGHELDVLLELAGPGPSHRIVEPVDLDVHGHVVMVASLMLVKELPVVHLVVVRRHGAVLGPPVFLVQARGPWDLHHLFARIDGHAQWIRRATRDGQVSAG